MCWPSNSLSMPSPSGRAKPQAEQPIVLVGFMAAGKSRIGRILADRLKLPFVDTDREIENSCGVPIAQLFRERGETEFRKLERELILALLSRPPHVIAVGGGAFVNDETRDALNRRAVTVWLDAPFELILERLARSTDRPLAAGRSTSELRALFDERLGYYAEAQIRIDTSDADPARILARLIGKLRQVEKDRRRPRPVDIG